MYDLLQASYVAWKPNARFWYKDNTPIYVCTVILILHYVSRQITCEIIEIYIVERLYRRTPIVMKAHQCRDRNPTIDGWQWYDNFNALRFSVAMTWWCRNPSGLLRHDPLGSGIFLNTSELANLRMSSNNLRLLLRSCCRRRFVGIGYIRDLGFQTFPVLLPGAATVDFVVIL